MATLSREQRKNLERIVLTARGQAEAGARKALEQLAVANRDPWPTMTLDQQALRRRLRARGRQLGDRLEDGGSQDIDRLATECAYEQWHRMLFARFLAECDLLIEPESGVSVSVDECKELARARNVDWIALAATFAQGMLPEIFRADDAVLEVALPAEHRQPLEQLLTSLVTDVFLADDSLGWVYQFWQSDEKTRVNDSEKKIGADELPAVTQLFTENYLVQFLLHNTLGAWWVGRRFPDGVEASSEEEARGAAAVPGMEWTYLRLSQIDERRWTPAAGTFSGWPRSAQNIRLLDPCMGSGHFLVAALPILAALRQVEEDLPRAASCVAVLRDNLFGLELDPRCTQIAAFNLALATWKFSGWRPLPPLNLACSGLGLNAPRAAWLQLATGDSKGQKGMEALYGLFAQAPVLGSLINPRSLGGDLLAAGFHDLQPLLERALQEERVDEAKHELAVTAQGITKAAELLAGQFTLVATNVPYLGRGDQDRTLLDYCEARYPEAKADLATCFVGRCIEFCSPGGSVGVLTPQNWLFLASYKKLRHKLLRLVQWDCVARLGEHAFDSPQAAGAFVSLVFLTNAQPSRQHQIAGIEAAQAAGPDGKALELLKREIERTNQQDLLGSPDSRILFTHHHHSGRLSDVCTSFLGLGTGDYPHYGRCFWEFPAVSEGWTFQQGTVEETKPWGGRESVVAWDFEVDRVRGLTDGERQQIHNQDQSGQQAWGKMGVAVGLMRQLKATLYTGERHDKALAALIPAREDMLPALWALCSSPEFHRLVRQLDHKVIVANGTLVKIPFELEHWKSVAQERYPNGLPKPGSTDATQWLFEGHPHSADQPLQVAVARLAGYCWPRQTGSSFTGCPALEPDGLEQHADPDGIICISPVKGQEPAETRLRAILAAAFGSQWSAGTLEALLAGVGYAGKGLEDWLRNGFFEQHCELFHNRPFIWQVWDGRRDGFSALLNCHALTNVRLEKLTYDYLGHWIQRQQAAVAAGEAGSDARLVAAKQLQGELKKILEGEPPYDIFVRWKALAQQPIGWNPDFTDGVFVNIRPFIHATDVGKRGAGILRAKPNLSWDKHKGKGPFRSKDECPWLWGWDEKSEDFDGGGSFDGIRWNGLHYSREFKMAARRQRGRA